MRKKALITGITGQDGSYLAEFLLDKGYEVHGLIRRSSTLNRERIDHLFNPDIYTGDLVEWRHFMEATGIYLIDERQNLSDKVNCNSEFIPLCYLSDSLWILNFHRFGTHDVFSKLFRNTAVPNFFLVLPVIGFCTIAILIILSETILLIKRT